MPLATSLLPSVKKINETTPKEQQGLSRCQEEAGSRREGAALHALHAGGDTCPVLLALAKTSPSVPLEMSPCHPAF